MNERAQKTVDAARSQLGGPYVFGAWGDTCTPELRRRYSGYNPDHKDAIYKGCQVLNGSRASCEGCKWQGCLAFDCRGFVHWCFLQAGIAISGAGATSQYNTASNWMERGEIKDMPDLVCAVYKHADGKKIHTGVHVGGGQIIHCSAGVQNGKTTDKGWTHYAVPYGLYTDDELQAAGVVQLRPVLQKGSKGEAVKQLQTMLSAMGYDAGAIDGVFGAMTAAALRCYQSARGLTIDAVCGPATWAALDAENPEQQPDIEPEQSTDEKPAQPAWSETVQEIREAMDAIKELCGNVSLMVEQLNTMMEVEHDDVG